VIAASAAWAGGIAETGHVIATAMSTSLQHEKILTITTPP
jgi:hypothetical protein